MTDDKLVRLATERSIYVHIIHISRNWRTLISIHLSCTAKETTNHSGNKIKKFADLSISKYNIEASSRIEELK